MFSRSYPKRWKIRTLEKIYLRPLKTQFFLCVCCLGRKLCIKITGYILHISRFSTLDIASNTHPLMSHHKYTHDEESMCILSTGASGRYARFLRQRPGMLLQQDNARPQFWRYASFIEWCLKMKWNFCVSVPLIYWNMIVCKGELLTFCRNLNNPTENDIKVKLAFLMALSIR